MSHHENKELSHEARLFFFKMIYGQRFFSDATGEEARKHQKDQMDQLRVPHFEHELSELEADMLRDNGFLPNKESGENFKDMRESILFDQGLAVAEFPNRSRNLEEPLNDVGVHHLEVPFGPEGYLIAHHLYQALKAQGASMEMGDGTYVSPEALAAVLQGPEGFGDWKSTKFVIVFPVSKPLKDKANELNALQEEAAQAAIALEEAQQRAADALNKLNAAKGAGKVKAGFSDYSAGVSKNHGTQPKDITPEEVGRLMASFQSLQKETQGYADILTTAPSAHNRAPLDVLAAISSYSFYEQAPGQEGWHELSYSVVKKMLQGSVLTKHNLADEQIAWELFDAKLQILRDAILVAKNTGFKVKILSPFRAGITNEVLGVGDPEGFYNGAASVGDYLIFDGFVSNLLVKDNYLTYMLTSDNRHEIERNWLVKFEDMPNAE